jgi:hypothetical protein
MQNPYTDSQTTAAKNAAKTTAKSAASKTRMPGRPSDWRTMSDLLCIWALCGRSACRKAGTCRGDSRECIARCGPLVPPNAKEWVVQMVGYERKGLSFNDARGELPRELEDAWVAWSHAVWRSARRRRGRVQPMSAVRDLSSRALA